MQASKEEIAILGKLVEVDRAIAQLDKQLQELPQRKQIAEARAKIAQIEQKSDAVAKLKAEAGKKLKLAVDEDERLAEKQAAIQESLDSQKGGYRDIEARTKEMNGYAKRRATLEGELGKLEAELTKIEAMEAQIAQLLDAEKKKEAALIEDYRKIGGDIQQKGCDFKSARKMLIAKISAELADEYDKAVQRCGGVAVGLLNGDTCSVCRSQIGPSPLQRAKAEAPISTCPSCKRLLVIQ